MIIPKRSWDWEGKDMSKSYKQMKIILFPHAGNSSCCVTQCWRCKCCLLLTEHGSITATHPGRDLKRAEWPFYSFILRSCLKKSLIPTWKVVLNAEGECSVRHTDTARASSRAEAANFTLLAGKLLPNR